jgi:hypothetical protein
MGPDPGHPEEELKLLQFTFRRKTWLSLKLGFPLLSGFSSSRRSSQVLAPRLSKELFYLCRELLLQLTVEFAGGR